jgi:signal transduction histidine kinase
MLEMTRALTIDMGLKDFLERLLATGCALTGAPQGAVAVLDEDGREGSLATFGLDDRSIGELIAPAADPLSLPGRGSLVAEITIGGQRRGTLYLGNGTSANEFSESDTALIEVMVEFAAIGIDRARLSEQAAERHRDFDRALSGLRTAMEIATAIGSDTDLKRILELIVEQGRELVDADALLIWLRQGNLLRIAAVAGHADVPADASIPLDASTAGAAFSTAQSVRIEDVGWMQVDPARFGMPKAHSALIVPLVHRGHGHGVLMAFDHLGVSGSFDADDQRALDAFAASAATAVATAQSVEAKRLHDTMAAAESERRLWARELHDETLQSLASLKLALAGALRSGPTQARAILESATTQLDGSIAALRAIIADLRPAALDELGLGPALRTLVTRVAESAGLESSTVFVLGRARLDSDIETIAYRVTQEALTNIVKHADARSVAVDARLDSATLRLTVTDDGCGFGETRPGGYGIVGMRERAALAAGTLEIDESAEGGTRVTLVLPLD